MYCELISGTRWKGKPILVSFADTTNETAAIRSFVPRMLDYVSSKYGISIDFRTARPKETWARYILSNGIPLISKDQARSISTIKSDMRKTGIDYDTVLRWSKPVLSSVKELEAVGFSKTGILRLTGYISSKGIFTETYRIGRKWLPMLNCEVDIAGRCCETIKEAPLEKIGKTSLGTMTGEQAYESKYRERNYMETGCIWTNKHGKAIIKPFGPMTPDGILYALKYRKTPISSDYGEIVECDGHYKCTKAQRTGCALCGFGCQFDTERFLRLTETDPAKIKFAFKPKSQGGAGYKEAIEHMNEYCGTKVIIPNI